MRRSSKLDGFPPKSAVSKSYSAPSLFSLASLLNGEEGERAGRGCKNVGLTLKKRD